MMQKRKVGDWLRTSVRAGQDGQSLIEAALVLPIFVTLLLGAAELAGVTRASISVANSAKAGVQYGAQSGDTAQDATGIADAAQRESPDLTLTTTSSFRCECSDGTPFDCTVNTACPTTHKEEIVTVNTQATVNPLIRLPGLPTSYTLHGQAVQKCLQ